MIDKGKDIQIQHIDVTFYLQDILLSHLIAFCVLDDSNSTVQLVQLQMMINSKAFSCLDMIKNKSFFNFSYI